MKHLTIAFMTAAALMSFGCKKKGGAGDMAAKMTELKDAMCKCTDKACADKVQADMTKWGSDMAKAAGDKPAEKPDEKTMAEMSKVTEEYGKCMTKAMTPAAADPAKPAEPAAPATGDCTKNEEGGFCITLPAGQKAQPPVDKDESSRTYDYTDDAGDGVTVVVTKMKEAGDWDEEVTTRTDEAKTGGNKEQQASDLPGGGKFWSWVDSDGKQWVTVLARKDMKRFFCRAHGKPVAPALVEACKSIRAL